MEEEKREKGESLTLPSADRLRAVNAAKLREQKLIRRAKKRKAMAATDITDILPDSCILFTEFEVCSILRQSKLALKKRYGDGLDYIRLGKTKSGAIRISLAAIKKYLKNQTIGDREALCKQRAEYR